MENVTMENVIMENVMVKNITINKVTVKQNSLENDFLLSMIQWEIAERLLPATIILYLLIMTGIVGNIAFIIFFVRSSKSTPPTILITCLAVADLGTCIAAVPVVSEMIVNVGYSLAILCKLTHFFGLWVGGSACFVLWLISIDRYRKICYPLAKQMSIWTVKCLVIAVTSFSLLLAVRYLVTYNSVEVEVNLYNVSQTLTGFFCTTNDDYELISLVFYSIDFLIIMMIWMTVIVTYSKIIYTIVKRRLSMTSSSLSTQNSQHVTNASKKQKLSQDQITISKENYPTRRRGNIELDDISVSEMKTDETQISISTIENWNDRQTDKHCNSSLKRLGKPTFEFTSAKKPSEMKLTLMMFAVSMIFILCFTPYFAIRFFIEIVLDSEKKYDFSAWIQFALKLPYINSACNPIIYFIFNPNFRRYILACCTKCRCRKFQKTRANFKIVK